MSEWKTYKLVDVAKRIGDGLHGTPKYDENGEYYFINGSNLINGKIVVNSNTKRVNETEYLKHKKALSENTILLGINGTIGNVALYQNEQCILGKSAAYINVKSDFDKQFIRYVLTNEHFQRFIKTNASGTTIKNVGLGLLREYEFQAPEDKAEQKEIAQILSSLDDKIEINLQMNQTLEAMAQAIFKEWFVHFNFPGFDGELVDGLPKGWRMANILELFEVTDYVANGSFASLAENVQYKNEPDYAVLIRLTDYNRGFNGDFVYVNEHSYNFLKKSKLFGDEIIIANVGANAGDVFRAPYLNRPMTLGPNAIMIKNNDFSNYLYSYLISELGQHSIKGIIAGSAQPKFNKTDFRQLEFILPDENTIELFNEIYKSMNEKLLSNKSQIQNLTQTRDTLLPKLMSGQLEVAV
ncbi:MAG: restriction endonuclease subunit S [Cyclobacteriaceae bacterium]|nr:restriction endonuclease subunit S [Cyclobacteriaceae bacterium]